ENLPPRFASLAEFRALVPVLPKAVLRNRHAEFLSERAARGSWEFSSGSTGTPTRFFWGHEAHWEVLRSKYRYLTMWGIDIFDPAVFLWGHGAAFQSGWRGLIARLRQPLMDRLRN